MKTARHGRSKGVRALLVTLVFSIGLLASVVGLRGHYARFLANHYRTRLVNGPDAQAEALLDRAARLGQPGIPVLVEAFASDRDRVAAAGRRALLDEVARWESLRARQSSPMLATLAEALADRADRLTPEAQTDAANLATQILLWPLDESRVDRGRVTAWCEKIIQAGSDGSRQWGKAQVAERWPLVEPSATDRTQTLAGGDPLKSGVPLPGVSDLPGGGLPDEPPAVADARARLPRTLDGPALEQPLRLLAEPEHAKSILNAPVLSPPDESDESDDGDSPRRSAFVADTSKTTGHSSTADRPSDGRDWIETVEIMRRLGSVDGSAAAQRELSKRGFTPVHVESARQLFDADPAVRLRLARQLPQLSSIDPVPWLLQLSKDQDAEVRRAAIALLATTSDPAVLARIERIARADSDPAIQRQAEQIARRRTGSVR